MQQYAAKNAALLKYYRPVEKPQKGNDQDFTTVPTVYIGVSQNRSFSRMAVETA